jgi:hypothetical protein
MKGLISLILLLKFCFSFGQQYSKLYSDEEIEGLILLDIIKTKKPDEEPKLGKKKILIDIIPLSRVIDEINYVFVDFSYDFYPEDEHFKDLFDEKNIRFYEEQTLNQLQKNWEIKSSMAKFSSDFSIDYYQYSLPLFNPEKNIVILYKTFYCGDLCGHGMLDIFVKKDNEWVYKTTIGLWIS